MHVRLKAYCNQNGCGPGTEGYSLMASVGACMGLWPRVTPDKVVELRHRIGTLFWKETPCKKKKKPKGAKGLIADSELVEIEKRLEGEDEPDAMWFYDVVTALILEIRHYRGTLMQRPNLVPLPGSVEPDRRETKKQRRNRRTAEVLHKWRELPSEGALILGAQRRVKANDHPVPPVPTTAPGHGVDEWREDK